MGNSKNGWISLHREIQDHWLWKEKPFSKGQAWIDLIMLANHQDGKVAFADHVEMIPRGSFITSQANLAVRWGWTRNRVRSFLSCLESDRMVTIKATTTSTTISLINYEKYQGTPPSKLTTNQQRTGNEPTTSQQRAGTNNKNKQEFNKNNNEKKGATTLPSEGKGQPTQPDAEEDDDEGWMSPDEIVLPEVFR